MDPAQEKDEKAEKAEKAGKAEAEYFLKSLINKTLRIHTTDSRMFVGSFKCTDPVCPPSRALSCSPVAVYGYSYGYV